MDEQNILDTQYPAEIQRLEFGHKAFQLPDLKLPSYDEIGKMVDSVFVKDEVTGTRTPRKPTFTEQLQEDSRKYQGVPNILDPIAEYSAEESSGFKNPVLPYDPTVDMNELYAKYDPVSWGDVLEKTWDTAAINMWSGTKNIWKGLTEGITQGRVSALWDNEYSRDLAEITDNLEKAKAMHFSADEQGYTSAWLKQLLPSLGYVASSVVEMAAQHAALSLGGAVVGAAAGEGVGAIPGAIVGNIAAYAKDAKTAANAITNINRTARTIAALSTANKIKRAGQLIGYGVLSANGEAALNAQMAAHRALEEQKKAYYDATGQYLTGDKLKEAEANASSTGSVTFALNLPLIAATNLFEFGNLIRGRATPQIAEKLAFKIGKDGKAVLKNPYLKVAGRYLAEAASEGNEEFQQGVIEDASVKYFTDQQKTKDNYLNTFAKATYQRAITGEGLSDFMGGALIGAVGNVGDIAGVKKVAANSKQFVEKYNSSTALYFNSLGAAINSHNTLKQALISGNTEWAKDAHRQGMVDIVNAHAKLGTTDAFRETLESMSDMDNADFRKAFGISLEKGEQDTLMATLINEYKDAAKTRKQIDTAFPINPFEAESWFQRKINSFKDSYNTDKDKAAYVWDIFKDTLTNTVYRHGDLRKQIEDEATDNRSQFPEFDSLSGKDEEAISKVVNAKKQLLQNTVDAQLPGYQREEKLLSELNSTANVYEQYDILLNYYEQETPGISDALSQHNQLLKLEGIMYDKTRKLNTKAGQRKEIKKIVDWLNYFEKKKTYTPDLGVDATQQVPGVQTTEQTPEQAPEQNIELTPEALALATPPTPQPTQPNGRTDQNQDYTPPESTMLVTEPSAPEAGQTTLAPIPPPKFTLSDTTEEDDLAAFYGEGQTEEYDRTPASQTGISTEAPKAPSTPETSGVPEVDKSEWVDEDAPETDQLNAPAVIESIEAAPDGAEIVPDTDGLSIKLNTKKVKRLYKEKGKVKAEDEAGNSTEINNSSLPLLEIEKAPASTVEEEETGTEAFIRQNNIVGNDLELFNNFLNGYIQINC